MPFQPLLIPRGHSFRYHRGGDCSDCSFQQICCCCKGSHGLSNVIFMVPGKVQPPLHGKAFWKDSQHSSNSTVLPLRPCATHFRETPTGTKQRPTMFPLVRPCIPLTSLDIRRPLHSRVLLSPWSPRCSCN